MSRVPEIPHTAGVPATASRTNSVYGILAAVTAAAIIAIFLTAAWWARSPAATEGCHAAIALAVAAALAASPGASVPEAGGIFSGAAWTVEEPSPTF